MFKIYDELVTPIEGACSRYMTVRSRQKRGRRVEDVRRIGIATRGGVFKIYGWLSKLWSLFGSLIYYGTYYLGYPKRDPNFDNYPYAQASSTYRCLPSSGASQARLRGCRDVGILHRFSLFWV